MLTDDSRILIIEDDNDLRESTAACLVMAGFQVTAVGTARAFYNALEQALYAVAIIDIGLPDQSGLILAKYLHNNSSTGVIILTARDGDEEQAEGYESGADIYLTKPVANRVLVSAIRRLIGRLSEHSARKAPSENPETSSSWRLHSDKWIMTAPTGEAIRLTSQEFRFLETLAHARSQTLSREDLTTKLYAFFNDEYTGRALDALVRRLRVKISQIPGSPQPIKSVYGVGFCFSEPISFP